MGRGVDQQLAFHARWCVAWQDALYLRTGILAAEEIRESLLKKWAKRDEQRRARRMRRQRKRRQGWA